MVRQKRNIDFGFWVNFRQEDRICRMVGEEKAETGDWRPERKGRATGEGCGDFGWWISDSEKIISTNPEAGVVAKTATGGRKSVK